MSLSPGESASAHPVVVVGAGWAGLAAAVELVAAGRRVTVVEAAAIPGGRARSFVIDNITLDNGQHLLLGAYSEVLRMLRAVGVAEHDVLWRRPLSLVMRGRAHDASLDAWPLPAPLHVAAALLMARGFSWSEKMATLRSIAQWVRNDFVVPDDLTVAQWLRDQPSTVTRLLWEPLCVAALTTPIERASAAVFARVLRDSFTGKRSDSDLLFARRPLAEVWPEPATKFIASRGGTLCYGERVRALHFAENKMSGVQVGDVAIAAENVVLAVGPTAASELLAPHAACADVARAIGELEPEAICTLYVRYDPTVRLNQPLTGMAGTLTQWVFDHGWWGDAGLLALVNSGAGDHVTWPQQRLIDTMLSELRATFSHLPAPQSVRLLREKRAAFSCTPGAARLRPATQTPIAGLYLAGDYTDTGYPSTLEGAVRSGIAAARAVMQSASG